MKKKSFNYLNVIFLFLGLFIQIHVIAGVPNRLSTSSLHSKPYATFEELSIDLYAVNANNSTDLLDGVLAQYDPAFSNNVDGQDALKFPNINESFAILRNSKSLSIERRQIITATDTLFLSLKGTTVRNYQFQFYPANGINHQCLTAYLEDSLLLTKTPIDLSSNSVINFSITSAPGSAAVTRFRIVYITGGTSWTGNISSNWYDVNNWLDNMPPTPTCGNVLIPATSHDPLISSGSALVNNINIQPNASLTVNNAILNITGSVTNTGIFDVTKGAVKMNGTIAQLIPASAFLNSTIKTLIVNNSVSVTMSGPLVISDSLTLLKGIFKLNNNYVTLQSDSANTAMVTSLGAGASIDYATKGNFVVERYFPARRAWRLITAPVSTRSSIFNSWQVGGGSTTDVINPAPPKRGTYISSPLPGPGLDRSINYSLDTFNILTGQLMPVNDTKNIGLSDSTGVSPDNKGYFIFIRGDRTPLNLTPPNANITTLRDTGKIQTGTKNFKLAVKDSFTLIGNPYPSPVDFQSLPKTRIADKFWAWDPKLNAILGGYAVVSNTGSAYTTTPLCTPCGVSKQTQHIQSGQAVFVKTVSPGTLAFTEINKSSSVNQKVFRPSLFPTPFLRANLLLAGADTLTLADGVLLQFDNNYADKVDNNDAVKFKNLLENLAIDKNDTLLITEARTLANAGDTIHLKLWNTTKKDYQLEFETGNLSGSLVLPVLADKFLHNETPINQDGITFINFSVSTNTLSAVPDRFNIIFKPASSLSVNFINVKAYQQGSNINVEWSIENEVNIKQYEVERSTDGRTFTKSFTIIATRNNGTTATYTWPDASPINGANYYRIKSISKTEEIQYSNIVKVTTGDGRPLIAVYPNPATGGTINLQLINQPAGRYSIRLLDKLGQVVIARQSVRAEGSSTETLQVSKAMAHGTYQLEVTKPDNNKITLNLIY